MSCRCLSSVFQGNSCTFSGFISTKLSDNISTQLSFVCVLLRLASKGKKDFEIFRKIAVIPDDRFLIQWYITFCVLSTVAFAICFGLWFTSNDSLCKRMSGFLPTIYPYHPIQYTGRFLFLSGENYFQSNLYFIVYTKYAKLVFRSCCYS